MRPSFSKEHFLTLWRAIFPRSYTQPIEDENGGESFDIPSSQAAIFAAASEAFEISQQAYFLKPHSIQTKPESSGEAKSTGTVLLVRAAPANFDLQLEPGDVFKLVAEMTDSLGRTVEQDSYQLAQSIVFREGELFPRTVSTDGGVTPGTDLSAGVPIVSELSGEDQNLVPGSIVRFLEFTPSLVTPFTAVTATTLKTATIDPFLRQDRWTSDMVNRYVRILGSSETLAPRRIVAFRNGPSGQDEVDIDPPLPASLVGVSGLSGDVENWSEVGLSVTQPEALSGGRFGWLDAIGRDRGMGRALAETDDLYRKRICTAPDIITPGAIERICQTVFQARVPGRQCVIKETRDFAAWPGLIYDVTVPLSPTLAEPFQRFTIYDADDALIPNLRPLEDVYVSERQLFRYFVICVEQGNEGEFGFFWDDLASPQGLFNFFDLDIGGAAGESFAFYDGFPIFWVAAVAALWRAVDDATAAGVGFEIIVDPTL